MRDGRAGRTMPSMPAVPPPRAFAAATVLLVASLLCAVVALMAGPTVHPDPSRGPSALRADTAQPGGGTAGCSIRAGGSSRWAASPRACDEPPAD